MMALLAKFFGVHVDGIARVASVGVECRNAGWTGWIVLLAVCAGGLVWFTYRDAAGMKLLSGKRRATLAALRFALILLILLTLLRPVLGIGIEGKIRREVVGLFDTSGSMAIDDPRTDVDDIKRATLYGKVADAKHVRRIDLVKNVLTDSHLKLLDELAKDHDLSAFEFGQGVQRIDKPVADWAGALNPHGAMTELGDAVSEVLNQKRGQPLAGILVVTDGANNNGSDPLDAARQAKESGVPLYIYGVGIDSPKDIILGDLLTQDVAFVNDELAVSVRVRGQALRGESGHLSLRLGDEIVAEQDVQFDSDTEQVVQLHFTPKKAGDFVLKADIPAREDEAVKDNNTVSKRLHVVESKIKVLYVEQSARWEFRYLQGALLRDRRVDFKCVLLDGDPDLAKAENSPYLATLPGSKEEWLKYDLVILGDVDPKALSPEQVKVLDEFVSKFGGSIVSIAGKHFNPAAYQGSPLEKLLPVELDAAFGNDNGQAMRPVRLELTVAGRSDAMLRLTENADESAAIWSKLPPIDWDARVSRAKPGAQVLLEDPDPQKAYRAGKMPVVAFQQYGLGQVLYVGTDNTWRWRKNNGEKYYSMLWGRIVQRMALAHLLGGAKRTQLTTDKQNYVAGERVTIYGRLYNENYEPVKEASVPGRYVVQASGDAGKQEERELALRAVSDQPGMYRGEFIADKAGGYRYGVELDRQSAVEFAVAEPRFEMGETALNEHLLREMAAASGGAFYREENLPDFLKNLAKGAEKVGSRVETELWATPCYFLLMVAMATAEWVLRKRWGLK
jgi:hypothetical protein